MKRLILALVLLPAITFAQPNAKNIQYSIIKRAIVFLSSDKTTSPQFTGKSPKCNEGDYECLKTYSDNNKITGASGRISDWSKQPADTKNDLQGLLDRILAELKEGKPYRKEMPSFKSLQKVAQQQVKAFIDAPTETAKLMETGKATETGEIASVDKIATPSTPPGEKTPATESQKLGEELKAVSDRVSAVSTLSWIAFIVGLLALITGVLIFIGLKSTSSKRAAHLSDYKNRLELLEEESKEVKGKLSQQLNTGGFAISEKKWNSLEDRVWQIERRPQLTEEPSKGRVTQPIPVPPFNSESSIKYAKLPDLGNGFSNRILSDNQNGEQIYEIEAKGNSASYSVSQDVNAQKYAMSDFNYYLSNACDFTNQPAKNCSIHTSARGTLSKMTEGWNIVSKAVIEFK